MIWLYRLVPRVVWELAKTLEQTGGHQRTLTSCIAVLHRWCRWEAPQLKNGEYCGVVFLLEVQAKNL